MIAYSAHYRGGDRVASNLTLDQAADLARRDDGFVWIALRDPSADELKDVAAAFGLAVRGIDGAGDGAARPRLEGYKGRAALTMRSATYDERARRIEFGAIKVFVGRAYVITVGRGEATDPAGARERLEHLHPELIATGPGAVIWAILDQLLDGYEPAVSAHRRRDRGARAAGVRWGPRGDSGDLLADEGGDRVQPCDCHAVEPVGRGRRGRGRPA